MQRALKKYTGKTINDFQSKTIFGTNSSDWLAGADGHDYLFGYGGNDTLIGNGGDDYLNGGTGADSMAGGTGDDTYSVDNVDDFVFEWDDPGIDTVNSSVSYVLPAFVENLTLTGTAAINGFGNNHVNDLVGNSNDNSLWGHGGDDTLVGGQGHDWLVGGSGADLMYGGSGDDNYEVDDSGDVVTEKLDAGWDTVYASLNYTLSSDVEKLVLIEGSAAVDGTGNNTDNRLIGNSLDNQLTGLGGRDDLDGKAGADTLIGGMGDDDYHIDDANDVVIEYAGEGDDRVTTAVSYTLGNNVEKLSLREGNIDGTGNGLDNEIHGGKGNNVLSGGAGEDDLYGRQGQDILIGGMGADTFVFETSAESPFLARDEILDFNSAEGDKIDLHDIAVFETGALSFIHQSNFIAGVQGQVRFENGALETDIDGDAVADFAIQLNVSTLALSDLVLD